MSEQPQLPKTDIDPAGDAVASFLQCNGLTAVPEFIAFEDHGYEENQCHISAKHRVITAGGQRVHGWALWEFSEILIGEFHSVWERPDGALIDVTPPKFGAEHILFVRDPTCGIEVENGAYIVPTDRTSWPHLPFVFRGEPSEYSHWPLLPTSPDLVRYCAKLGLPDTSPL